VRVVLGAPAAILAARRQALNEALGANARLIIDVVPELEEVVGPRPALPALGMNEAHNRFEQAFEDFLGAIVMPDEPLALWAGADADQHMLAGRPRPADGADLHVRPHLLVDPFRRTAHGELAQSGQVPGAEKVMNRMGGLLGDVDLAFLEPVP